MGGKAFAAAPLDVAGAPLSHATPYAIIWRGLKQGGPVLMRNQATPIEVVMAIG